jgi:hypothetical protein
MKSRIKTTSIGLGRPLGLLTSTVTLLGALIGSAAPALIVNNTFDPPSLTLFGWEDGTTMDISRQYVNDGVGGSMAVQVSADFVDPGGYVATMVYQDGQVVGDDLATPQNTVLSFDVKVDRPDLKNLEWGLQSSSGFMWNVYLPGVLGTASRGSIALGTYIPGVFKTVSVAVDDPLWIEDPYAGPLAGPFDPSGKTYQIWFQVDAGSLTAPGHVTVTIDNIMVSTRNPMVPWKAASTGTVAYNFDTSGNLISLTVMEKGVDTHLGKYNEIATLSPISWGFEGRVEITAANGDKLVGTMSDLPTQLGVTIEDGTGRFKGAKGSYLETLTWTSDMSFNVSAQGRISNVGSGK